MIAQQTLIPSEKNFDEQITDVAGRLSDIEFKNANLGSNEIDLDVLIKQEATDDKNLHAESFRCFVTPGKIEDC